MCRDYFKVINVLCSAWVRPEQYGWHFAEDITSKGIIFDEKFGILIQISLIPYYPC